MTDAMLERVRTRGPLQKWRARFARRDDYTGTAPDWKDYIEEVVTLNVTVRTTNLPRAKRPNEFTGWILSVVVAGGVQPASHSGRIDWAEYSESDYGGTGEFLFEEWRMQLLEEVECQQP